MVQASGLRCCRYSALRLVTVALCMLLNSRCVVYGAASPDDHDLLVRSKRSNIPCGSSFTPCNARPSTFSRPFSAQQLDAPESPQFATAPNIRRQMLTLATSETKDDVDRLFNLTEPFLLQNNFVDQVSTSRLWAAYTKSYAYAKDLSYSALISIGTSQRLTSFGLRPDEIIFGLPKTELDGTVLKDICPPNPIQDCVPGQFRTFSGYCNNVNQPLWGASFESWHRFLAPDYSDAVSRPRRAKDGNSLPNPRELSVNIFTPGGLPHKPCTQMVAHWAQFVYEDLVHLGAYKGANLTPLPCCDAQVQHPECYPVNVSANDPTFRGFVQCFSYARTNPVPRENCLLGTREQMNMASAFLDGSQVYGSKEKRVSELRAFEGGKLKSSSVPAVKDLLPAAEYDANECRSSRNQPCFLSGSDTVNILPTTVALHTVWLRQHNRVAEELKKINPHWDDERLFLETRRIIIAQLQHITFNEFLPLLVGFENMQKFDLELRKSGYFSNYDLQINPNVMDAYASAVGNFFITLLPKNLGVMSEQRVVTSERPISEFFYDPSSLYFQDRLDGYLRYMLRNPIDEFDTHINEELTTHFLKGGGGDLGFDWPALIVHMGRDHGLPGYVAWRSHCGLGRPRSWNEIKDIVREPSIIPTLQKIYRSVEDIDLFVLGLAERPITGALFGPTFACLMAFQFQKARRGDRFWYENFFYPSSFSEEQLSEIRKITLARVICDNTDSIKEIQPEVFMSEDIFENCPIACNHTSITRLNYDVWVDAEPRLKLPITEDTLQKAVRVGTMNAVEKARMEGARIPLPSRESDPNDPIVAHASVLVAKPESLDRARIATILLETTKVLVRGDALKTDEKLPQSLDLTTLQRLLPQIDVSSIVGNASENKQGCVDQTFPCDHTSPYRSFSGWCNNLRFPSYGNAFMSFRRLLDPIYNDGFDEPRKLSRKGLPLPSARAVSNAVHAQPFHMPHVKYTHMLMQYAQILDHDLTHSPIHQGPNGTTLNCTDCNSPESVSINCIPIDIPKDDPFFPPLTAEGAPRCMAVTRSLLGQLTLGYREQINQLTSYLDASQIYGSTECQAKVLRLYAMGKLNYTEQAEGLREGLPQGFKEKDCRSVPRHMCFIAGDSRANEQVALTALHTSFLREHNRIATRLYRINNFWPDERIYLETRRIFSAMLNHVTFNEFLPKILGMEVMAKYGLLLEKQGYYKGYDPYCDAQVSNEFAVAAFRFGHTLIRADFQRRDDFYNNFSQPLMLRQMFLNTSALYDANSGSMDTILLGLVSTKAEAFDRHINEEVRSHLFEKPGNPFSGMDLPAINIQRARDHGVQPYNDYRELCGLPRAHSFDDLRESMGDDATDSLRAVYADVDDIDLFPGLMSEKPVRGGVVGPTTACILAEQFQRSRKCDRFWYENDLPGVRFTPDQLAEIRKTTLAKIICANSQFMRTVQPKIFDDADDLLNARVPCQDLPDVDLYEWLDRQFCVVDHRVINLGQAKRIKPCVSCTCTAEGPECHSVRIKNCQQLLDEFLFSEVVDDTVCMIQCSAFIKRRAGQL